MNLFKRCASLLPLLALLTIPLCAYASDLDEIPPPPIEWGKINVADLQMKTFPADTNASAVILCDYGETKLNNDFNLLFKRHLRVKILKEKGFEWGTHSISLYKDRENGESVDNIEAITYTLDNNGKIVEHEMNEDDVITEAVSDKRERVKFTLPSLQPGCVIEIRYEITARSLMYIKDWVFQHDEPVLWSEYRVLHPISIAFDGVKRGFEKFAIDEQSQPVAYFSGEVAAYFNSNMLKCTFRRWAMEDLPALRDEPYITTLDDYYSKIELQFAGMALRGGGIQRVLHTWEELVKELQENPYVGDKIKTSGDVKDLAQKLTANIAAPLDKMKAIYAWVAGSIVWDGYQTLYAKKTMDQVLDSKKGNSAEINYLVVSLCRAAGLQADPLILSTRANGLVQNLYPIVTQFNLGIGRVTINGTQYYLDATDPNRPWNIVPAKTLGVRALVIQDGSKVEWVSILSEVRSITTAAATVTLDVEGNLKGTLDGFFKGYANINVRNALKDKKPVEVAKDYFSLEALKVTVDSAEVVNKDSVDQPIKLKTTISSEGYGQAAGELIYVNPHLINRSKDNPFKSANRKFPVDYNYPREYSTYVTLVIPDSFEIKEMLPNKYLNLDGQIKYTREFVVDQNRVQLKTKFEIPSKDIPPKNYQRLKEFYSSMIQTEAEQLVLQKVKPLPTPIAAPEPPAQPAAKAKKVAVKKK